MSILFLTASQSARDAGVAPLPQQLLRPPRSPENHGEPDTEQRGLQVGCRQGEATPQPGPGGVSSARVRSRRGRAEACGRAAERASHVAGRLQRERAGDTLAGTGVWLGTYTDHLHPGSCCLGSTRPPASIHPQFHLQDKARGDPVRPRLQAAHPSRADGSGRVSRCCHPQGRAASPQSLQGALAAKQFLESLGCGSRTRHGRAGVFLAGGGDLGSKKLPSARREPPCRKILRSDVPFSCGCCYLSSSWSQSEKGNRDTPRAPLPPAPQDVPSRDPHPGTGAWHLHLPSSPPATKEASEALLGPGTLLTLPPSPAFTQTVWSSGQSRGSKGQGGSPGPTTAP